MTRRFSVLALLGAAFLCLAVAVPVLAQKKAGKKGDSKDQRLDGRVVMVNKDTSTITVRDRRTNAQRQVVYDASTRFTFRNKEGKLDDVKDGIRVICLGKFDDKARLMASRVDIREGR